MKNWGYARKPFLSREGANVTLRFGELNNRIEMSGGDYGAEGFIYQALAKLPDFDGRHPVIGSWIIGQEPAGMGIRETTGLITTNTSRFVPHIIL
jgi:glutathionylspermidine synthase